MCYISAMNMKRTNYYYPTELLKRLKEAKQKTGIPVSEMLRRGAEMFLASINKRRKP